MLEIYRAPEVDAASPFGWHYASREIVNADGTATPLAAPSARIVVRDLLP